jgi:hypothetical protein
LGSERSGLRPNPAWKTERLGRVKDETLFGDEEVESQLGVREEVRHSVGPTIGMVRLPKGELD